MKRFMKKGLVCALVCSMMTAMCAGCGKKDDGNTATGSDVSAYNGQVIVKAAGHEIYTEETMMYCLLELMSGQVAYSYVEQSEETFEADVINLIVETKIIYDKAIEDGMEFTTEDEAERDRLLENFKSLASDDILAKYGISDEMVNTVITEYCYAQKYEYEINQKTSKEIYDKYTAEYADYNFQKLYIMVFPTVEVDASGNPVSDGNGGYKELDADRLEALKKDVEAAIDKVKTGGNAEEVAKEYGVDTYSATQFGYEGSYNAEINSAIDGLDTGDCSDLLVQDNCYYFITLVSNHDEEYKDEYIYKLATKESDEKYESEKSELIKTKTSESSEINNDFWTAFSLTEMAKLLYDVGIMG